MSSAPRSAGVALLRVLRTWVVLLLDTLVLLLPHRVSDEVAVIVRLDALGDFFIWMQSGAVEISRHVRQSGHRAVLLANASWADYARQTGLWDDVLAVDPVLMMKNPLYRLKTLARIRGLGAQLLIQCRAARVFLQEDAVARISGAALRIGSAGTEINSGAALRSRGDAYYDRLIPTDEARGTHEVVRNDQFTFALTGKRATPFPFPGVKPAASASRPVIFALGAGQAGRVWPVEKLAQLLRHVKERYPSLQIVVLGVKSDRALSQKLESLAGAGVTNRVGETKLAEYVQLIAAARLVICNDSSAYHIAMALRRNTVCFLGGGHYGWFAPYPASYSSQHEAIVLNVPMDCYWCNWMCRYPCDPSGAFRCVSSITIADAVGSVDAILAATLQE
jgi:ADP-heptose:LPS heptosyltransferase